MKKKWKLLAIMLAVLMLAGMTAACRQPNEENWGVIDPGGTEFKEPGSSEDDPGNDPEDPDQPGDDPNDPDTPGTIVGPGNADDPSNPDTPGKSPTDTPVISDPTVKYTTNNPLVAEGKKINYGTEVSYDIDTTGFVKNNIRLADLRGKSLTLITAIMYNTFQYKNEKGEYVGEWKWWESLKDVYGLNIKYIKSRFDKSVSQSLTYMNAGKALDVIPTHVGGFPKFLTLSQPLDPYINIQNIGNSPGVDEMTLQETKWGGTYRCISAIGAVNVLWYNQSLVEQLGLKDPHTSWQKGEWNWNTWEAFVRSVPQTTPDGKALYAYNQCGADIPYSWALTNGIHHIKIDTESETPNLVNNWMHPQTLAAWEFVSGVLKGIKYGGNYAEMYSQGTVMMSDAVNLMNTWDNYEYAQTHKYNWVPFPKATASTGRDIAFNYGYTMMLPKKMKTQSNAPYAVKFMELWANRFTEAVFDYFETTQCIGMDYKAKKEYFEFVVKSTYFGVQMNEWDMVTGDNATRKNNWFKAFSNAQFNITTESTAMKNVVEQAIKDCLAYGS
ncbi:MAG: hypothetical protein IJ043_10775 [Clostridia bacterium]|nr:hypothetical protein [Clostridia bacterium]